MNTVRVVAVAGIGWIPVLALAAWWAGFAPFASRPVDIGEKYRDTPQPGHPPDRNSNQLITAEAARRAPGYLQWKCDGSKPVGYAK